MPLYALSAPCSDPRYPALAGPWAVGCGPDGLVDRAISLRTGRQLTLPHATRSPALDDAAVYLPTQGVLIHLTESGPVLAEDIATVHEPLVAPAALYNTQMATLSTDRVQSAPPTARARRQYDAHPVGWYPPALTADRVFWVDTGGEAPSTTQIWWMPITGGPPKQLAASGRHVVASTERLAWVTDETLVVHDLHTATTEHRPVRTGFSAPPTLWKSVLCWEEWSSEDIDIHCDDGLSITRLGHQQWPSRHDTWLMFREDGRTWLMTAPSP